MDNVYRLGMKSVQMRTIMRRYQKNDYKDRNRTDKEIS